MDNNMIRIDDLVRQRLSGGEEPERSGAWLNMRELLDKEMPQAAGPNWRRIIGYLSLLLLLGAGSIGGYKWYQNGIGTAGGRASAADGIATSLPAQKPALTDDPHARSGTEEADRIPTSKASISNATRSKTTQPNSSNTSENIVTSNQNNSRATQARASLASRPSDAVPQSVKRQAAHKSFSNKNGSQRPVQNLAVINASKADMSSESKQPATAPSFASRSDHSVSVPKQLDQHAWASGSESAPHMKSLAPHRAAMNIPKLTQPQLGHIRRDSVQRLELVSRRVYDEAGSRYVEQVDTFPLGKFARTVFLPLIPEEMEPSNTPGQSISTPGHVAIAKQTTTTRKQVQESKPILSASAKEVARNDQAMASKPAPVAEKNILTPAASSAEAAKLATNKTSSRHFNFFDFERLAAVMDQVKSNLQRIELYPGLVAGINASMFTPNALGGIQAGITSLFILNDSWSLMTELKYFQRYNTGSSVRDDYKQVRNGTVNFIQKNGIDYKRYTWEEGSIRHSFNYDVIRTFELPVMMRRSWGRAYAQGGVNLVLSSAIAATEISDSLNDFLWHSEDRPATHDNSSFISNDHPLVYRSDFGSRFGIGYVLSAGYMFSPNIYVDGRITQTVWDNSKTDGARQVAQDLLRTPSIQISVGYKFGPKEH